MDFTNLFNKLNPDNIELILCLQHKGSKVLKIILEPFCEHFIIDPGDQIKVHGIFNKNTDELNFTIEPNDDYLIIYPPGELLGFVDFFIMKNGVRLIPIE